VNAFVLPGGYVAVFAGLIRKADGPDELAGVLAHEVAHGVARHPMEQLLQRSGYSLIASLVTGDMSGFAVLAGDAAAFIASMANSRADEAEADRMAMHLLNAAGIDSRGLPRFFEKLEDSHSSVPQALALVSTHPINEARMQDTRALAQEGRAALSTLEWRAAQQSCPGQGAPD
jgi:predicted Zn-dependent protease